MVLCKSAAAALLFSHHNHKKVLSNEVHSETLTQGASQLPEVELVNFFFIKQTFWNFLIEPLVTLIDIQS